MVLSNCGPRGYPGMAEVGNRMLSPKLRPMGIPKDEMKSPFSRVYHGMDLRYNSSSSKTVNAGRITDAKRAPLLVLVVLLAVLNIVSSGRGQSSDKAAAPSDREIPTSQLVRE